jgi:hypothetical protein
MITYTVQLYGVFYVFDGVLTPLECYNFAGSPAFSSAATDEMPYPPPTMRTASP